MRLVILESPYSGKIEKNIEYARACVKDSLSKGEAPIASYLLYTQPGILNDDDPIERKWGIDAGLAWHKVANQVIVYIDHGISKGMDYGIKAAIAAKLPIKYRTLYNRKFNTLWFNTLWQTAERDQKEATWDYLPEQIDDAFERGEVISEDDILLLVAKLDQINTHICIKTIIRSFGIISDRFENFKPLVLNILHSLLYNEKVNIRYNVVHTLWHIYDETSIEYLQKMSEFESEESIQKTIRHILSLNFSK